MYVSVCVCVNAQNCLDGICPKWIMLKRVKPSLNSDLEITKKLKKKKKKGKRQMERKYKKLFQVEVLRVKTTVVKTLYDITRRHPTQLCLSQSETPFHQMTWAASRTVLYYSNFSLPSSFPVFHSHCINVAFVYHIPNGFFLARCCKVIPDTLILLGCLCPSTYSCEEMSEVLKYPIRIRIYTWSLREKTMERRKKKKKQITGLFKRDNKGIIAKIPSDFLIWTATCLLLLQISSIWSRDLGIGFWECCGKISKSSLVFNQLFSVISQQKSWHFHRHLNQYTLCSHPLKANPVMAPQRLYRQHFLERMDIKTGNRLSGHLQA